ncbi:MAG: YwdI family protein [Caryophanon sp.]|nr:YwdI family protein [Caryophanon sp.]
MISKDALLQALAKELQAAQAGDEQATREALSAIRALCDVALSAKPIVMPMTSIQPMSIAPTIQPTRVEENGANGDSIFDF